MNLIKTISILLFVLFFTGCASFSINEGTIYGDWDTGEKKHIEKHVFTNVNALAPSTTDTVFMECKGQGEQKRCKQVGDLNHDTSNGFISGLGGAAVTSTGHAAFN